jgi:hypothetical protein
MPMMVTQRARRAPADQHARITFADLGREAALWACWEVVDALGRVAFARRVAAEEAPALDLLAFRLRAAGIAETPTAPESGLPPPLLPIGRTRSVREPDAALPKAWEPDPADVARAATPAWREKDAEIRETFDPFLGAGLAEPALRAHASKTTDIRDQAEHERAGALAAQAGDVERAVNRLATRLRAHADGDPAGGRPSWEWRFAHEWRFLLAHVDFFADLCRQLQQSPESDAGLGRTAARVVDYLAANHPAYYQEKDSWLRRRLRGAADTDERPLPHRIWVYAAWILEFYGWKVAGGSDRQKTRTLEQAVRRYCEDLLARTGSTTP